MKYLRLGSLALLIIILGTSCTKKDQSKEAFSSKDLMIRMAEIEIHPEFLNQYLVILKEESEASVRLEEGVIAIYPMFQKENPNEIRILEIYTNKEGYQKHLQTPHFKKYKTSTSNMVKTLKLIEMDAVDETSMPKIFYKLKD
ncbi:putative quinol monooxygenase [Sediminicola sp. 1XM1-17]|uniref:putative quinol monooxygenase n=1 Tax=Sediminicola sp. 1XM1-17 TaxID=3127702 RepID=UPI00307829C3